uniref:Gag-Pol polyprotein n=1 Tax=Schizaphis graminum TaxID=13262 RepID=A0A2S2PGR3_SCHGA
MKVNIKNLHVYNAPVTQGRIQRGGQGRKAKKCFNCGKYGHVARNCRKPPKKIDGVVAAVTSAVSTVTGAVERSTEVAVVAAETGAVAADTGAVSADTGAVSADTGAVSADTGSVTADTVPVATDPESVQNLTGAAAAMKIDDE